MSSVATLRKNRGYVKRRLTKIEEFANQFDRTQHNLVDLSVRLKSLDEIKSEFDRYSSELLSVDDEGNAEANVEEAIQFEERITLTQVKMLTFKQDLIGVIPEGPTKEETIADLNSQHLAQLIELQAQTLGRLNIGQNAAPPSKIGGKLPPLRFKSFDGRTEEYISFTQTFDQVIDGHNLNESAKYWYLTQNLKGEPLNLITSLENEENAYTVARETLEKRYGQKRLLVNNHLRVLFGLSNMKDDTSKSLRLLLSETQKQVRCLQHQKVPVDQWGLALVHWTTSKLHSVSRGKVEEKLSVDKLPEWPEFVKILEERCEVLEAVEQSKRTSVATATNAPSVSSHSGSFNKRSHAHASTIESSTDDRSSDQLTSSDDGQLQVFHASSAKPKTARRGKPKAPCVVCKESHSIYSCPVYRSLSPKDRLSKMGLLKACINCLNPGHSVSDCRASSCFKCKERHHTTLHDALITATSLISRTTSTSLPTADEDSDVSILLATAVVITSGQIGQRIQCRALLDSCSQANFITRAFFRRLKVSSTRTSMNIKGIAETMTSSSRMVELTVASRTSDFAATMKFVVLPTITSRLPSVPIDITGVKFSDDMPLADPLFHSPGEIEMLIGAELFFEIIGRQCIRIRKSLPIFYETKLGFIAAGKFPDRNGVSSVITMHTTTETLSRQIQKFWQVEEVDFPRSSLTREEQDCEDIFQSSTTRNANGAFVVRLPKALPVDELGNSYMKALACLRSLERRFQSDEKLRLMYIAFMREYRDLGHMELVNDNNPSDGHGICYIPHLPVLRPEKKTTRMRTVFNASAQTSSGISLNDILKVGPSIQSELWDILIRFRLHRYVFTADVEKMYRCVKIHEQDADLQRILWREDSQQPVQAFRLKTVTYGTAPASFLATRCLQEVANLEGHNFPAAVPIINDFYIDDVMTGSHSIESVQQMRHQLTDMLSSAGFKLHKWSSNYQDVLDSLEKKDDEIIRPIQDDDSVKTLGLLWNTRSDSLHFSVSLQEECANTKREILSQISKLFDPLGLVNPVVVTAKHLMQQLWKGGLKWDEALSNEILRSWEKYSASLADLKDIAVPRWIQFRPEMTQELHGFCDASEIAYGAAIYVRILDCNGVIQSTLLCSKSRVAPIKAMTIPRMELNGALLLAKLALKVVAATEIKFAQKKLWCDSKIVLAWIATDAARLKQYVGNRIEQIQRMSSDASWHYVKSGENPADLVSRGSTPIQLAASDLWWHGPAWLMEEIVYPEPARAQVESEFSRELRKTINLHALSARHRILHLFSSSEKTIRVVAIWHRYFDRLKALSQARKKNGVIATARAGSWVPLSAAELRRAFLTCARLTQAECFATELIELSSKDRSNRSKSSLRNLLPFLDTDGIMRVGGRLQNSDLNEDEMHPIIMPSHHDFVTAFVRREHVKQLHAGPTLLLSIVRKQFWPIGGRSLCRRIVRSCIRCCRARPTPTVQRIGQLPSCRVNQVRPFLKVGIDYAGPILVKSGITRNARKVKAYIGVFVCMATKAAHLELIHDLSTAAFLAALKRFIARRGKPAAVFSDNGSNFVGANRQLTEFFEFMSSDANQQAVNNSLASDGIAWTFTPPYSPHQGGIWEALVKSAKFHLSRVVNDHSLTFEELTTLLCEIEAVLNSRPLVSMSDDPDDLRPLTPGDFLIGHALVDPPPVDLLDLTFDHRTRWHKIDQLKEQFWNRWRGEYLPTLQRVRNDWTGPRTEIKVDDLVVINDDSLPPGRWPLGRIVAVHPGPDGIVRNVDIKMASKVIRRAVQYICVIPVDETLQVS